MCATEKLIFLNLNVPERQKSSDLRNFWTRKNNHLHNIRFKTIIINKIFNTLLQKEKVLSFIDYLKKSFYFTYCSIVHLHNYVCKATT